MIKIAALFHLFKRENLDNQWLLNTIVLHRIGSKDEDHKFMDEQIDQWMDEYNNWAS